MTHNPISKEPLEAVCRRAEAALTELGRRLQNSLSRSEVDRLSETVRRLEARSASLKYGIAQRLARAEGETGANQALRDQLGMTGHQARRISQVARKLEEMPNTRTKLQTGEITLENATSLVRAAAECGAGRVDRNRGLLAEAAAANPDDFRKRSRRWASAHSRDRGEEALRRQRRRRRANLFWSKDLEMGILQAELDPVSFGQVRQALDRRADRLRRADSGGEVRPDDVRTGEQRRADALVELLTGRDADAWRPLPDGKGSGKAVTQLVVVADLGLIDGARPDGLCEILGTGPVPPSVLDNLSPDTSVCGIIFGGKGRVLWLGRNQRLGNGAQRLAAAVRDRGCVRCDAPVHLTELHHLRDWYDGGPTDIDNLVSLCGPHHRQLQERNLELVKTGNGWRTRPRSGPPAPPPPRSALPPVRAGPAP